MGVGWAMDALAHPSPKTQARRALLNATIAALPALFGGRGVTQLALDTGAVDRLRAAGMLPRTLLHPGLPGSTGSTNI